MNAVFGTEAWLLCRSFQLGNTVGEVLAGLVSPHRVRDRNHRRRECKRCQRYENGSPIRSEDNCEVRDAQGGDSGSATPGQQGGTFAPRPLILKWPNDERRC